MSPTSGAGMPEGLRREMLERGGRPTAVLRRGRWTYWRIEAPEGPLLGRASIDRRDAGVLEHEERVRALVGEEGALRAPRVLRRADAWALERRVLPEPWRGAAAMTLVARAAERVAELRLPERPAPAPRETRVEALRRRVATLRSPALARHLLPARRAAAGIALPLVTGHRDFDPDNVFLSDGAVWAIDWELAGPAPAGEDLLRFWTCLEDPADRESLFEATVDLVGAGHRRDLLRLRYAVAVRTAVDRLAGPYRTRGDERLARSLIARLPDLRAGRD